MGRSLQASQEGITKAKEAFTLKAWTQDYLASVCSCTRQTIGKFFAKKSIDKTIFQNICTELGLDWKKISHFKSESEQNISVNSILESVCEKSQMNTSTVITASVPQESITREAIFVLTGTIKLVDQTKLKAIEAHLRQITGDVTLTITNVEEGSIKITIEGSSQSIEKLAALFESGHLAEVLEFPVENVEVLPTEEEEEEKSRLIEEIKANGAQGRDLTGADLSGADLSGTDLNGVDLFSANLSDANLSAANLSNANLRGANLRGANLSDANLRGANLSDANLRGAKIDDKTQTTVEVTISLSDPDLDEQELQEKMQNLLPQIREVDGVEEASLVEAQEAPEKAKGDGFIVGTVKAMIVPGSKALFDFLKERLTGKPIELTVTAPDGRELTIKVENEEKFNFAYQKAQEFLNALL